MRIVSLCILLSLGFAQDPDAVPDPNRGLNPHEVKPFSRERKMKDIEKEQLAKYVSIDGKLIPREKVDALYLKNRVAFVFNRKLGMEKPMPLNQFLLRETGLTAVALKKVEGGAKKLTFYDPYAKKKKTVTLPGKKVAGKKVPVNRVIELSGKVVRRFGPKEVVIETGGKYMGILSENSIVEDKHGRISLRVFKTVKATQTRKVRFGTNNLSVPMYQDVTLTAKDFALWARRDHPFVGLKEMLKNDAVSPDVAAKLSRPSLKSSRSLNPKN